MWGKQSLNIAATNTDWLRNTDRVVEGEARQQ